MYPSGSRANLDPACEGRGGVSTYQRFTRWASAGTGTERAAFFSDAVFAISLTLLAVEIKVPDVSGDELPGAIAEQVPHFLAYVLSFAVIGAYWMTHHRLFNLLRRFDGNLLRLNLLVLLLVALVGYATGVLVGYGDRTAGVIIYAAVMAAIGFAQVSLWVYAWRGGLMNGELERDLYEYMRNRSLVVPIVFLLSVPLALWDADAAKYWWIAILVLDGVLVAVYRTRGTAAQPLVEKS